jgi:hypothetical protein
MTQEVQRDTPTKAGCHFYRSMHPAAAVLHFLFNNLFDATSATFFRSLAYTQSGMLKSDFRIAKPRR